MGSDTGRPRRVLVDARPVVTGRSGVGVAARGLLAALRASPDAPAIVAFEGRLRRRRPLVGSRDEGATLGSHGVSRVALGLAARLGVGLDRFADVDLAHALDLAPFPLRPRIPLVATIHDAFPWTHPEWFGPRFAVRLAARGDELLARAARVIVPTRHVAEILVERRQVDPGRIDVVPHGIDLPPPSPEGGRSPSHAVVEPPYLLAVGTIQPRKNVVRLVQAFRQTAARASGWRLVVAGAVGWAAEPSLAAMASDDRVRFVEAPGDALLDALRRGAGGAVVPSLDEGFGLPVLEALAHGLAVLVGEGTGAHEVGGEVVLRADPRSVTSLAQGLDAVVAASSDGEAVREARRARAARFPWSLAAERTLAVWRRAASGGS